MADINPIHRTPAAAYTRAAGTPKAKAAAAATGVQRGEDAVTVSSDASRAATHARLLEQAQSLPEVREDLIARVKQQIDAGTYVTPDKLNHAVEGLLNDL